MIWANTETGKATASPGAAGNCPSCGADLIPKCGSIISWHWAHKSCDCDNWSEPESEWHLGWKRAFPANWQEVTIGPHRADVLCPKGVIEFQKSSISADEIREREAFYRRMVWVVWAGDWCLEKNINWHLVAYRKEQELLGFADVFGSIFDTQTPEKFAKQQHAWECVHKAWKQNPRFTWSPPRKSWFAASKPVFMDLGGDYLLRIKDIYHSSRTFLNCKAIKKTDLIFSWSNTP